MFATSLGNFRQNFTIIWWRNCMNIPRTYFKRPSFTRASLGAPENARAKLLAKLSVPNLQGIEDIRALLPYFIPTLAAKIRAGELPTVDDAYRGAVGHMACLGAAALALAAMVAQKPTFDRRWFMRT